MVRLLSHEDKAAIEQAVLKAEKETDAELAVVIARASDEYRTASLCCGLFIGCFIALLLWDKNLITDFPTLLFIELCACAVFLKVNYLRHWCVRCVPRALLHQRAAQRALLEYVHLESHLPAAAPVVLIYISLAEQYVHVLTSRNVQEKIPVSEWGAVVSVLIGAVKQEGVRAAVLKAVERAAAMLKIAFPSTGMRHIAPQVRQIH